MTTEHPLKSGAKWLVLIVVGVVFLIPVLVALRFGSLWEIYRGYVETVSNFTGLNTYLTTALAALLFVPFSIGVSWLWSWRSDRRRAGEAILLALFVFYNLALFLGTRHAYFQFRKGETLKWYALTPDGVQLYDRAGVDPKYGIELKPVTKDVVRQLELMQHGEFKPIDPATASLFNPITGEAQVWFYRYPDGKLEFYDKPGFHPTTGETLQPVTKEIYFSWKIDQEEVKRQAEAVEAARRQEEARRAEATRGAAREEERRRAAEAERRSIAAREAATLRRERELKVQAARDIQRPTVPNVAPLAQPVSPTPIARDSATRPWMR